MITQIKVGFKVANSLFMTHPKQYQITLIRKERTLYFPREILVSEACSVQQARIKDETVEKIKKIDNKQ